MVIVARVWVSRSISTPSLASTAWCKPSLQRRPHRRPVYSSTMMTLLFLDDVFDVPLVETVGPSSWEMVWIFSDSVVEGL